MNEENDFLKDIEDSLADQVTNELTEENTDEDKEQTDLYENSDIDEENKPKKSYLGLKILAGVLCVLVAAGVFFTVTPPGRRILIGFATKYMYSKMQKPEVVDTVVTGSSVVAKDEPATESSVVIPDVPVDNIDMSQMSDTFKNALHEDGVYNIILLGVESIGGTTESGHTDSMMIATLNTNAKTLGISSLMRDTYVDIPGFGMNKLNAAFRDGGTKLLYETIAENYNLRLDGSVFVDFDAFEKAIDAVGGVDIELTAVEAQYLNRTNYISIKSNRTMREGMNHMNGNQALGYCRVRHVATLGGVPDDQGRTKRHRAVMEQIFEKAKKDPTKALSAANAVLPYLTTDIKEKNMQIYLSEGLELMLAGTELRQQRVPDDEAMSFQKINGAAMTIANWDLVKPKLYEFIFAAPTDPNASGSAVTSGAAVSTTLQQNGVPEQ